MKFKIYHPEYLGPDTTELIEALDDEHAAEKYAESYDSAGDYSVISGSPLTITVEDQYEQKTTFTITGETVPVYSARRLEIKELEAKRE